MRVDVCTKAEIEGIYEWRYKKFEGGFPIVIGRMGSYFKHVRMLMRTGLTMCENSFSRNIPK